LKGALTCNIEFGECCVMDKKMKVKFGTIIHHSEDLLDCVHVNTWGPTNTASLENHQYFVPFIDDLFRLCWVSYKTNV